MELLSKYRVMVPEPTVLHKLIELGTGIQRTQQEFSPNEAADYNHQLKLVNSNHRWLPV